MRGRPGFHARQDDVRRIRLEFFQGEQQVQPPVVRGNGEVFQQVRRCLVEIVGERSLQRQQLAHLPPHRLGGACLAGQTSVGMIAALQLPHRFDEDAHDQRVGPRRPAPPQLRDRLAESGIAKDLWLDAVS